ncbi:MAG: trimeric intracellular cation channel family protein [Ruminococcaceae bacterium]|nr:trimeric intracellular cation channel family protein [Oscillospiraceae bacterium]
MLSENLLHILEFVGTISFAISGALVAIRAQLDIFGVIFIGGITAVGGGIVRDLLIGRIPPSIFSNGQIMLIAILASVLVFLIAYFNRQKFEELSAKIESINNVFDAVGLATFTVMGTEVSFLFGFSDNIFLTVVLGMLTGVGGGIFRDILTDTTPYIFKKHIYALASIFGSLLYYFLRRYTETLILATVLSLVFVVVIRMLATKYLWSLPKIRFEETDKQS